MTTKVSPSRTILEVERAISDLRRGQGIILTGLNSKALHVTSGEHYPQKEAVTDGHHPAVRLMKLAGLLPRAVVDVAGETDGLLSVSAQAVAEYPAALAGSTEKVSDAIVPLAGLGDARVIAFRPRFGHEEHLAIVIGKPLDVEAPYVRIHSSCVTGDVFASLRCDCGDQLHEALHRMHEHGAGVVLYLSQEGRGIGIANKLRAYQLQDKGMDTVEANVALGFDADERDFALAACMLKQLGIKKITLLTNNPDKVEALVSHGIEVEKREKLVTETNKHNQRYLETKAEKMGHQF